MKSVKAIVLVCENCEEYLVESKYIGQLAIENISQCVRRIAVNDIDEYSLADKIVLEVYKEFSDDSQEIFERLVKYNDITSITLLFENGGEQDIYTDYDEADDSLGAPNTLQHSYISKLGNLYITIGNDINLNDYIEDVDDEVTVNFIKEMIMD